MDNLPLKLIKLKRHEDHRGFFSEIYSKKNYKEIGIDIDFVQENQSFSRNIGTLRGLHFQSPAAAQGKLVRCSSGSIYDVAVDIRIGSPTYGDWYGYELSEENGLQLFIPIGYAHGFVTLKQNTEVIYKCTNYYSPENEGAIHWDSCGIKWPIKNSLTISDKDQIAPNFIDLKSPFAFGENS
jgi:dTDP-4-dehydrorhamnose 3,5-epimerase|tara:strand:+ start:174 stop:719 length:546 start_codon:yes stop_codon:yes gene_type:complete